MSDTAIRVTNLSKRYRIGLQKARYRTLRESITEKFSRIARREQIEKEYFWALKDIDFEVKKGESLGIIGRNGAGKSTLLKILSRITKPTKGRAVLEGRVGSLLEVGTGFHPELTGRENIFLNGAILGMLRAEIERKFDEIVAFSEIEQFLDTPVKRYSSGMYVRLAFAVAAYLEPEILIVDEVLAVGDTEFQKKCLGKMGEVAGEGRTVLFVSHNMGAVQRLCERSILLKHGQIDKLGLTPNIIEYYMKSQTSSSEFNFSPESKVIGKQGLRLLRVSVKDSHNKQTSNFVSDSAFNIEIEYQLDKEINNMRIGFRILNNEGIIAFSSVDTDPIGAGTTRQKGTYISKCTIPPNLLNSGQYYLTVSSDKPMIETIFFVENIISFTVELSRGPGTSIPDGRMGIIRPSLSWEIQQKP